MGRPEPKPARAPRPKSFQQAFAADDGLFRIILSSADNLEPGGRNVPEPMTIQ